MQTELKADFPSYNVAVGALLPLNSAFRSYFLWVGLNLRDSESDRVQEEEEEERQRYREEKGETGGGRGKERRRQNEGQGEEQKGDENMYKRNSNEPDYSLIQPFEKHKIHTIA